MITVTENAVKYLRSLLAEKGAGADAGLVLAVENGGCAGMQYTMKVGHPTDGDHVIYLDPETKVIVAADSTDFLRGSQVDYSDSLTDSGFKIVNPNASRSCGCGTSFEPSAGNPAHSTTSA